MATVKKEAYYKSDNGVNMIRALIWHNDEKTPVGAVQLVHGVSEHIGRYDEFARFLADSGYVVFGNDHIGHGKSVNSPDELGNCPPDGHVTMLRDMNTLYRIMHKRFPDLPYIIFGHSMGSLLARVYAASFASDLSGAVFCGTAHFPSEIIAFEDAVKAVLGKLPESAGNIDVFGKITKLMLKENDDLSWLSRSTENIERHKADPLCGAPCSPGMNNVLYNLAVRACSPWALSALPAGFPVLIISGAKDPVGLFGKGVMDFADALTANGLDPEVYLYPGLRHEILNEDERAKVFFDVLDFLDRITAK